MIEQPMLQWKTDAGAETTPDTHGHKYFTDPNRLLSWLGDHNLTLLDGHLSRRNPTPTRIEKAKELEG